MADLIVLGGCAGVEAAKAAAGTCSASGVRRTTDDQPLIVATPSPPPTASATLGGRALATGAAPESMLIDRAHALALGAEMTVLVGGLRAIGATAGGSSLGVLTKTRR